MKKSGISHVEIILSFIIFVTAIGFALFFFSPSNSERLVESSLNYGFREITNNVSVEVSTYSVVVDNSGDQITGSDLAIFIDGANENSNMVSRVESLDGDILPSVVGFGAAPLSRDTVYVSKSGWTSGDFIYVRLSEDFEDTGFTGNLPGVNEDFYEIASANTEELVSEKRIEELSVLYSFDYIALKEHFNLPGRVNFGFSLTFAEDDLIESEREIPVGLEVFSEIERKEVLRKNGEIQFGDLAIWVW